MGGCKLTINTGSGTHVIEAEQGTYLREILINDPNLYDLLDYPCGGKGTCGKCRVFVKGNASRLTPAEVSNLTEKEINSGVRLACQVYIQDDIEVKIKDRNGACNILVEGLVRQLELSPLVKKKKVLIPRASLQDSRDDFQRIRDSLGCPDLRINKKALGIISEICNGQDQELWVTLLDDEIIDVSIDEIGSEYGFAVDIGTTTLVGYLVNMKNGKVEATVSGMNLQRSFGADVLSRVSYCMENPQGHRRMQEILISQLDGMLRSLLEERGIPKEAVCSIAFTGNTIMLHFLLGLKTDRIAVSPFTPVYTDSYMGTASDLGFIYHPHCPVYVLPSISGYVGADIVAGILACHLTDKTRTQMLVDVGTNGEMALSHNGNIQCCSVAAGPAFEGAHIHCGVGGIEGAIDEVIFNNGRLIVHTLGGKKPVGLCGSGIIDMVAILLKLGVIDETGRFSDIGSWQEEAMPLYDRMQEYNSEEVFVISYPEETATGLPIYLSAQDIREVQLAKAAVYAGIKTLIRQHGIKEEDIDVLWLAGSFGSRLKKESAVAIGLIPKELAGKIQYAGNSSGSGCIMALLSEKMRMECDVIKKETHYLELSGLPGFSDEFIGAMSFDND